MDSVARCRQAATDAIVGVDPPALQELLESILATASMAPGVLTIECGHDASTDEETASLLRHAAGVQLIYEGLRLTRTLAHDEPWGNLAHGDHGTEGSTIPANGDPDFDILAADILVARGFHALANTDAAWKAVDTVRTFGRDQTERLESNRSEFDANLERDVLELATLTAAATHGEAVTNDRRIAARRTATILGTDLAAADRCLLVFDRTLENIETGTEDVPLEGSRAPPVTGKNVPHDRATSATDR